MRRKRGHGWGPCLRGSRAGRRPAWTPARVPHGVPGVQRGVLTAATCHHSSRYTPVVPKQPPDGGGKRVTTSYSTTGASGPEPTYTPDAGSPLACNSTTGTTEGKPNRRCMCAWQAWPHTTWPSQACLWPPQLRAEGPSTACHTVGPQQGKSCNGIERASVPLLGCPRIPAPASRAPLGAQYL